MSTLSSLPQSYPFILNSWPLSKLHYLCWKYQVRCISHMHISSVMSQETDTKLQSSLSPHISAVCPCVCYLVSGTHFSAWPPGTCPLSRPSSERSCCGNSRPLSPLSFIKLSTLLTTHWPLTPPPQPDALKAARTQWGQWQHSRIWKIFALF